MAFTVSGAKGLAIRNVGALAGQNPLWKSRDEYDGNVHRLHELLDGLDARAAIAELNVGNPVTLRARATRGGGHADTGATVLVTGNALRLLRFRPGEET
jgi:hypothetical protein